MFCHTERLMMNSKNLFPFKGLSPEEVITSRLRHGANSIARKKGNAWLHSLKDVALEPMFLLLVACAAVYFVVGAYAEAWFMLVAILLVSGISFYQDTRSRRALQALQAFSQPFSSVLRDDELVKLPSGELVVGDYVVVAEGELIAADGVVRQLNDFSVNESILTGEAYSVAKDTEGGDNKVFSGTLVTSGQCVFEVTATGEHTRLGEIGKSIDDIATVKTPLQLQISAFVRKMAVAGIFIFLLIWLTNFIRSGNVLDSLLRGLTIAMSVLPEEIPVAFATFMALGAYRLMRSGIIVKHTGTVEALGSVTVLCTDKTGTITENRMEVYACYDLQSDTVYGKEALHDTMAAPLIAAAMWSSEAVPFDPMEVALHRLYENTAIGDKRPLYRMVHEYPLEGKPPIMTHVFEDADGKRVIAGKGAPERLMRLSGLSPEEQQRVNDVLVRFGKQGLRVLAVATAVFEGADFPASQDAFSFHFLGLVSFYDPPKKAVDKVFRTLYDAGIRIKLITGDSRETAVAIGEQVGLEGYDRAVTSKELSALDDGAFDAAVMSHNIFSRVFPDLKLRIVESLKKQGQVVGMTGDGVNDGPALKAAHIGIAMGKQGTEIAKSAASLIFTDDDFGRIVDAVAMGRRIYTNLKKAIQYIISIHIPIILTVAVPSLLGWVYPAIFSPVHVIFLELIMGPTCSIIYEREPLEQNSMLQPPRAAAQSFFRFRELLTSIIQGIGITFATLLMYRYGVHKGYNEDLTRSMVFSTLIFANIFLTLVNRSFFYSVFTTLRYRNPLLAGMLAVTFILLMVLLYVPPAADFFKLVPLSLVQLLLCLGFAFVAVGCFEVYKLIRRLRADAR